MPICLRVIHPLHARDKKSTLPTSIIIAFGPSQRRSAVAQGERHWDRLPAETSYSPGKIRTGDMASIIPRRRTPPNHRSGIADPCHPNYLGTEKEKQSTSSKQTESHIKRKSQSEKCEKLKEKTEKYRNEKLAEEQKIPNRENCQL